MEMGFNAPKKEETCDPCLVAIHCLQILSISALFGHAVEQKMPFTAARLRE